MGAQVIVSEIDPIRALEALMDGNRVMTTAEAAPDADVIITVTGDIHAIGRDHIPLLKDGVVLSNSGHFNVEIDIPALEEASNGSRELRPQRCRL